MWNDSKYIAFDFETSGELPEYALQPWRVKQGKAWVTSLATVRKAPTSLVIEGGLTGGSIDRVRRDTSMFLTYAIENNLTVVGWNVAFDISWLLAYGFEHEVNQLKFLDGMLLWKHLTVEPEYDTERHKKRSYGLKAAVAEILPQFAGYESDVDFHAVDAESLLKLQKYNEQDTMFTLRLTRHFYNELAKEPQRLKAALIEADCLPLVAKANLEGMLVDVPTTETLGNKLVQVAEDMLTRLAPHGVNEKVVRSPKQLSKLMFEDWGLPVFKQNVSAKTGNVTDSTDKEVLHELSFVDPRAAEIRLYREALGNKTKFVDAPLKSVDYNADGRTHPLAMVFGTYCVPGDVEVLTRKGWERLDTWSGGDIAQVTPNLSILFLPAQQFVGPVVDTWVSIKRRGFDCLFTHGHTVPYLKQKTFKWATTHAGTLLTSGEAKYIPVAGEACSSMLGNKYNPDQMRLFVATQADGCSTKKELKFMFKKVRKIVRMRHLLRVCGIVYREYVCDKYPDRVEFHITKKNRPAWLGHDKKQFGPWVLDATYDGLVAFVNELQHWDGSPHVDGGIRYVSAIESNVTWATTAAALVGRKASTHTISADMYSCHISDATVRACKTVKSTRDVTEVSHTTRAYCATTHTGFWLARSKGQIFVTGNTSRMTYASKQGRNKDERQIGFALHQMKRGKDFRSIIAAPPGYTLMEFDASGQEVRWMAIASGDENMLQMCMPGEDLHTFMGAAIGHVPYPELRTNLSIGDISAKSLRQLGKVANLSCIAASNRVLTDRGYIPIVCVTLQDRVWDGTEWVTHGGVVYQGEKHVIQHQGLTLTPDHRVLTLRGWRSAEACTKKPAALASGHCWKAIWSVDGYRTRITNVAIQSKLSVRLWVRAAGSRVRSAVREKPVLPCLLRSADNCEQRPNGYVPQHSFTQVKEAVQRSIRTVHKSYTSGLQVLRSAGYHLLLRFADSDGAVRFDPSHYRGDCTIDYRQDRQYARLLSGEHTVSHTSTAVPKPQAVPKKEKVYDILDCGPRNRFVVEGVVVHNCQYRTSAKKLKSVARVQYSIPMEQPEADSIHATYRTAYPKVPDYWRNQIALTKHLGYVETFAGRRVQVVGNWRGPKGWSMESTSINYRIQGTGGDQKYLALSVLRPYITRIGAVFAWELHDGIYFYVPDAMVEKAATEIPYLLANLPYKKAWGFTPPIPLPWDCKYGKSWGELKDWK